MTPITLPPALEPGLLVPGVVRVLGDARFQTDGDVLALAFAGDGSLWSVEEPGLLRQWHPSTGQQLDWHYLSDLETLWHFSPDGRQLASASDDLTLWDVPTGQLDAVLAQPSWVSALAYRADGRWLATGHDDYLIRLWDLHGGQEPLLELDGHQGPVSALAFSPDGTLLASAGEDKRVHLWHAGSGRQLGTLEGHTDRIQALAWHPGGDELVSAGWDTTARVWDRKTLEPVILLNSHAAQVTALAFSPGGRLLACADSDKVIHVWDYATRRTQFVLQGHTAPVTALAFNAEGTLLASGGADRVLHLWDVVHGRRAGGRDRAARGLDLSGFRRNWTGVALRPDGRQLACTAGMELALWDTATGNPGQQLNAAAPLHALAYRPDGRQLAVGGADADVRLFDPRTGALQATLSLDGDAEPVTTLAYSADGSTLAAAGSTGTSVLVWDVAGREPKLYIPDALDGCTVETLAFHPQNGLLAVGGIDWLATGGSDGAICLWDLTLRCEVATLSGGTTGVAFRPDGRHLASAALNGAICIWDMESQELIAELTGHEDTVTALAYSPGGHYLATGGDDRTVHLWDADTGALLHRSDLTTQVKTLAFSPDGRHLYTGNGNTTCYQMEVQRLLDEREW